MRPGVVVLSLLLPGVGHALLRKNTISILLLIGYGGAVDAAIISKLWFPEMLPGRMFWLTVSLAGTIWVYSAISIFRLAYFRHRPGFVAVKDQAFKQALDLYLQDRYNEARAGFLRVVKLDPEDVEAQLYLSLVETDCGRLREADRHLSKAKRLDAEGKWGWELARQESLLRAHSCAEG